MVKPIGGKGKRFRMKENEYTIVHEVHQERNFVCSHKDKGNGITSYFSFRLCKGFLNEEEAE